MSAPHEGSSAQVGYSPPGPLSLADTGGNIPGILSLGVVALMSGLALGRRVKRTLTKSRL